MTKRDIELENARLRGQIEILERELLAARSTRIEYVPTYPTYPTYQPVIVTPQPCDIGYPLPYTITCGGIIGASSGAATS